MMINQKNQLIGGPGGIIGQGLGGISGIGIGSGGQGATGLMAAADIAGNAFHLFINIDFNGGGLGGQPMSGLGLQGGAASKYEQSTRRPSTKTNGVGAAAGNSQASISQKDKQTQQLS